MIVIGTKRFVKRSHYDVQSLFAPGRTPDGLYTRQDNAVVLRDLTGRPRAAVIHTVDDNYIIVTAGPCDNRVRFMFGCSELTSEWLGLPDGDAACREIARQAYEAAQ